MRVTFLGTGTSHGIPVIGCNCAVCCSHDPKDRRSRCSVLIENQGLTILVDSGPELRLQLLQAKVRHVDALLLTHAHTDHTAGLDDVRIFSERTGNPFPVYGSRSALAEIRKRFDYVFHHTQKGGGKPRLELHAVHQPFKLGEAVITPIPLWHGRLRVFGYRIGKFAYLTDVSAIPKNSYRLLTGLSVLVLDALRPMPHETHFHLARAVEEAKRVGAKRTYFTHMCHLLGHKQTERLLPSAIRLGYDGLKISF